MEPQFPLRHVPACQWCKNPCTLAFVSAGNLNGNFDRPYYTCLNNQHPRKFSTWNDYEGIINGNPRCWCGFTSRRDKTNGPTPTYYYTCPERRCSFTQDALPAPHANNYSVFGQPPLNAGARSQVYMDAPAVEMKATHRKRGYHCCVVM